jgi:hypothetical protein
MRRQTKFNANVVYVRKGARLFPNEDRGRTPSPVKEEKPDIGEVLKKIEKIDKEVTKLLLKIRLELESLKPAQVASKEGEGK